MKEVWKDIKEYEGLYQISNLGRIKSLPKKYSPLEIIMKCQIINNGYYIIHLKKEGKRKNYLVHRLVAEEFIKNTHNKKYVNHKDGNKTNNNIYNLEWVTMSENHYHAFKLGLKVSRKGEERYNSKLINNNVNPLAISKRLGHAKVDMTLNTYSHLYPSSEEKMLEILNEY